LYDTGIFTKRYEDKFSTPDEIIFKNFTDKEINIIKGDPVYFKLNKSPFKEIGILKNLNLIKVLESEETCITTDKIRRKIQRASRQSTFRFNTVNKSNNYGDTSIQVFENMADDNFGVNRISKKFSTMPTNNSITKLLRLDSNKELARKSDQLSERSFLQEISEITDHRDHVNNRSLIKQTSRVEKKDFNSKMQQYEEKRKFLSMNHSSKIKQQKEKFNATKKLSKVRIDRENEELYLTNVYLRKIKDNYSHKKAQEIAERKMTDFL
jgi:hypothetical protein